MPTRGAEAHCQRREPHIMIRRPIFVGDRVFDKIRRVEGVVVFARPLRRIPGQQILEIETSAWMSRRLCRNVDLLS